LDLVAFPVPHVTKIVLLCHWQYLVEFKTERLMFAIVHRFKTDLRQVVHVCIFIYFNQ